VVRAVKEGLLLLSGAGAVLGSLRKALNHGFVWIVSGEGVEAADCVVEAAGPWVLGELCSRDNMWVWV